MRLKLSNIRQRRQADCLVACAMMALIYVGKAVDRPSTYSHVYRLLGTSGIGTPINRLDRLQALNVIVTRGEGNAATIAEILAEGLPMIVDVATSELTYWQMRTDIAASQKSTAHAVVVVGIANSWTWVNDPDFADAPQQVLSDELYLAWQLRDCRYAFITRPIPAE